MEQLQRERARQRVRHDNRAHPPDRDGADAAPGAPPARRGLAGLLSSRDALRQAVVLAEVLGPPKGLAAPTVPQRRATAPVARATGIPAARDDHEDRRPGDEGAGDGDA